MKYSTTNVRIETDVLKELKLKAVHEGKRVAELIREAVKQYLGKRTESTRMKDLQKDSIFNIIGICETGCKNDSVNHSEVIYGWKKK